MGFGGIRSSMKFVFKGFIGFIALLMLSIWLTWMISPEIAKDVFEVDARSITGINALKSDMGGSVLAIAVFLILSFVKGTQWLYSAAVTSSCLMLGRTISLVVDGYTPTGVLALVIELIAVIIFVTIARQDSSNPL